MIAQLLISQSATNLQQQLEKNLASLNLAKNHPDVLYLTESSIGIKHAKTIKDFFAYKPYQSQGKTVIIENAENITMEAQNALLKTLEELPDQGNVFIGTLNQNQIIPTVLSRCQLVYLDINQLNKVDDKYSAEITKLIASDLAERFKYVEKLKEKPEFLIAVVSYFHQLLLNSPKPTKPVTTFLEQLLTAEKWSKSNVNLRGILEYLMIVMPDTHRLD